MLIPPDSTVQVFSYMPIDSTYADTFYFGSASAQRAYFDSKVKYTFSNVSYQREKLGTMRVEKSIGAIRDCNYLAFQNTAFYDKWFYAFINKVTYVSNTVTEIEYELDVMQTYMFDYSLNKCFVVREHSAYDTVYYHRVAENLDLGESLYCNSTKDWFLGHYLVLVTVYKQGMFSSFAKDTGLDSIYYTSDGIEWEIGFMWVNSNLDESGTGQRYWSPETTVSIFSRKAKSLDALDTTVDYLVQNGQENSIIGLYASISTTCGPSRAKNPTVAMTRNAKIGTYTPRNKKLLCYPYNFVNATNFAGDVVTYRWEDFSDPDSIGFRGDSFFNPSNEYQIIPRDYRGITYDFDSSISICQCPVIPYNGDTFAAWYAQNANQIAVGGVSSAISGLVSGVATGAMVGSAAAGIGAVPGAVVGGVVGTSLGIAGAEASYMAQKEDLQNTPAQTYNTSTCSYLNAARGTFGFRFMNMSIMPEQAERIDSYFDRYGYACHQNKIPNRCVRPYWTYTQTAGCSIKGTVPAEDAKKIVSIYDNGVTFWRYPQYCGDYAQDNRV